MRRYAIIIELGEPGANLSAYVPDLPGCVTTGDSVEEVKENMQEAIQLHLHGLSEDGEPIPQPTCLAEYVEVPDDPERWKEGVVEVAPLERGKAL